LVLPFWYRLTQVVREKRPLNGCSRIFEQFKMAAACSCSCSLAVLDPRVGHTMDVLSLFITVLSHSD